MCFKLLAEVCYKLPNVKGIELVSLEFNLRLWGSETSAAEATSFGEVGNPTAEVNCWKGNVAFVSQRSAA
ncbi:MAG: hypothetical protein ACTS53_02130 [Candidatus Hodgkinia cicadicola]